MSVVISKSPEKELEIEFLRCGTHTSMSGSSHNFTHDIAQEIVDTYNPDNFKAPLIISHRTGDYSDRSIVESELAFGTPKFLKKVGDRVKAVFEKISPEFIEWVRNNQILGISPSFYPPNHQSNPTPGKWSLRHIAGLGKSPPAIKGLASLSLSEFLNSPVGAIDLGEFEYSSDASGAVTLDFEVNALSEVSSDKHCIDFMVGEGYEVFQRLRDYLIEKEGVDLADRIIPSYYLQLINEPQPKNDYPFELIEQLMMRVSDLETKLTPLPLVPIYSEGIIDFALPKIPGTAKKKCTKGTACGGSCISANKTCKKKQSADGSNKTKALKGGILRGNDSSANMPSSLKGKGTDVASRTSPESTTQKATENSSDVARASSYGENFRKAKKDPNIDEVTVDEFVDLYAGKYYEFSGNGRATVDITNRKNVERAINDGIYLEDAAIDAHPTLKKKYASQIAKTNAENERWQEIHSRVNKPVLSPEEAKDYKPFMSADEAANYTQDSFFSGVDMFHGTSAAGVDSIASGGVDVSLGRRGLYGEGFYMGVDENVAKSYAAAHADSSFVTTRVKAKNPYTGDINGELRSKLAESGLSEITGRDGSEISMFLKANGYDSIYIKEHGYLVALDNKQVVTVAKSKITETKEELSAMMLDDSAIKNNKNYKLLSEID